MFKLFKKKDAEDAPPAAEGAAEETSGEEAPVKKTESIAASGDINMTKLATELDRVKAGVESFGEVRKSLTERISHMSEQIGELRAMILDRDRTIQEIELKSVKAADLVETVQPEKLMVELQKVNAKFEALKANLEGNEAIIDRVMDELKETRRKIEFFRGIEEIVKLSEEVKKEIIEIKRVEATISINTDKVQTIYSELKRKFQDIDAFRDSIQEIKLTGEQNSKDVDVMKIKISELAQKDDLEDFMKKVQKQVDLFKQATKSSAMSKDLMQLKKLLENVK